ncbi:MAG: hypothetical protein A3A61_03770 [Candidatus Woykebacteria bacterium RIFCSPLOWO2_01_FULL_43_14]|uniref:Transketolase-like pyrimidine-binding domain-containing protein n=2 Tax=Candidatus Woykeibacteriota TaxID=1817899 RepID=A0A1G1WXZ3_9BACT|nr:MAG: hypothetical protein A3J50_01550 [Candidatus Woykebacteria bacterium RIFCSPHIGHO2_02_FULL_43_16b]OGY32574.1 MAG: hypothetical protein A3A61_03770 [Candidatus Woykebacteria bacterium RIFCSPLOWO2_01_FULL_43_14]
MNNGLKFDPSKLMRARFARAIHDQMAKNKDIYVIAGDLGYKMWDTIRTDYPDRFINTGAAEQTMMGLSVGLALKGKIPVVYSITTFLLYRPFETIRNYVHHEKIPVKLIGAGRNRDYRHDGISHWAEEDREVMKILHNIKARWPDDSADIDGLVADMVEDPNPWYINLKR